MGVSDMRILILIIAFSMTGCAALVPAGFAINAAVGAYQAGSIYHHWNDDNWNPHDADVVRGIIREENAQPMDFLGYSHYSSDWVKAADGCNFTRVNGMTVETTVMACRK